MRQVVIIWIIAVLVAIASIWYINHAIDQMITEYRLETVHVLLHN